VLETQRDQAVQHGPGGLVGGVDVAGRERSLAGQLQERLLYQLARRFGRRHRARLDAGQREQPVVLRVGQREAQEGAGDVVQVARGVAGARDGEHQVVDLAEALVDRRRDQPRLVAEVVVDGGRGVAAQLRQLADGQSLHPAFQQQGLGGRQDRGAGILTAPAGRTSAGARAAARGGSGSDGHGKRYNVAIAGVAAV
jgi:hypothetical protein